MKIIFIASPWQFFKVRIENDAIGDNKLSPTLNTSQQFLRCHFKLQPRYTKIEFFLCSLNIGEKAFFDQSMANMKYVGIFGAPSLKLHAMSLSFKTDKSVNTMVHLDVIGDENHKILTFPENLFGSSVNQVVLNRITKLGNFSSDSFRGMDTKANITIRNSEIVAGTFDYPMSFHFPHISKGSVT